MKLQQRLPRRVTWRGIITAALILLAVFLAYKAWRVGSLALALKARAERMLALQPEQAGLEAISPIANDVHAARSDLHALRTELALGLAVAPALGWSPLYGAELASAPALMDMAVELVDAGDIVLAGLAPQIESMQDGKLLSIPRAVQMIQEIQPVMEQARPHLERAVQARARITRPLSPRAAGLLSKVDKVLPLAVTAADAAALAPDLLGMDGPRTYLVLAQNSDELRPSGGFISSVGRVVIERGEIVTQTFEDSYAVDNFKLPYPDPPAELLTYMGSELWVFRDANWSPDFPTSARDAIRLYQISRPGPVHGVIALNLGAVPTLFDAMGPLAVAGFDQPITGKTVVGMMRQALLAEYSSQASKDWWAGRKDFMGTLANAVLARVQGGMPPGQMMQLGFALLQVLDRRDVLIYLDSPEAQRLLAQRKWDGALLHPPGDFLMVVDTNMGFNKVNPNIDEQLAYTMRLDDAGRGQATLVITHTSRAKPEAACDPTPRYDLGYDGMMNRCYWDLLRVYAPMGSALVTATVQAPAPLVNKRFSDGKPAMLQDQDKAVFESFFALNGKAHQATRFEYTLPPVVGQGGQLRLYSLYIQRQPATNDLPLELEISLPPGAQLLKTEPPSPTVSGRQPTQPLRWSLRLSSDQQVRVWYRVAD